MYDMLQWAAVGFAVVLGLVAVAQVVVDRPPGPALLWLMTGLEVTLIVLLFAGILRVPDGGPDLDRLTYVGYLGGLVLVPVGAGLWAAGERSRAGSAVYVLVGLLVPFLLLRAHQVWVAGG